MTAFGAYYDLFYPADDPEGGRSPNRKKRVPDEILKASTRLYKLYKHVI